MMTTKTLLPQRLYSAAQTRELDRVAIEDFAIPGFELMQRAGQAAMQVLLRSWAHPQAITIFCGVGNNGGDGFVMASLAKRLDISVRVFVVGATGKIKGDARLAYDAALQDDVAIEAFTGAESVTQGIIVDALLGTGLQGKVREAYVEAIAIINKSGRPVLAVDIPSGLCSDAGTVLGCCVQARQTVTFIGIKQGLLTGQGPAACGDLHFSDLNIPEMVYQRVPYSVRRINYAQFTGQLKPRARDAHKGMFGHVLVIGGDYGMAGAVAMAAEAAARTGAGLVSVATRADHVGAIVARRPEVMAHAVASGQDLESLLSRANVIVIGPGLGRSAWSAQLLQFVLDNHASVPLIIDADALNIVSEQASRKLARSHWILTPHPGEAARLLDCSLSYVKEHRFEAVAQLQKAYGGVVVLKGAGSLICQENEMLLCDEGNPGMASGGMGDVLSGIIGALVAQQFSLPAATQLGVCMHAAAADRCAAQAGERGLLASDLFPVLRELVNPS